MRKMLFLLLTVIVLWSCQNQNFTIQGTVADAAFEGTNVYLQERINDDYVTLKTTAVRNGTFTFTGAVSEDTNILHHITLDGENRIPVFLERGTVEMTFGDVVTVSGTKVNTLFSEFRIESDRIRSKLMTISPRFRAMSETGTLTDESRAELLDENNRLTAEMQNLIITFIRDNIGNAAGRHVLIVSINMFPAEIQEEFVTLADDNLRTEPVIAQIITRLQNARNVAVGNKFVNFTMNDPEGNEVSLSDFAGQGDYTLIVFWATWCGPCIQVVPHLREVYAKYRSRGFEIVGVSLDRSHDDWVNGLERLNITWPQMSDMKVWQSPVVELYAFRGIPHSVLLDREGIIIANNLRGEELNNKLAELMP